MCHLEGDGKDQELPKGIQKAAQGMFFTQSLLQKG